MFLTLGGSHAYGTNIETSDLDIRGCAFNTKKEILLNNCFEQVIDNTTDTCVYGFNKLIKLLTNCNPNVIELLGLPREKYFLLHPLGEKLIEHSHLFLSKQAINTFGGYAYAQLRRLDNKAVRTVSQSEQEIHILHSIENAKLTFKDKYFDHNEDDIKLYVDNAVNNDLDSEIFMDINLKHYPLRDYKNMWSEMKEIVKEYAKNSKRNNYAAEHGKLAKHMMHLIRLYLMCTDILLKEEIITTRTDDHDLLMSIRNGDYLDENNQPIPAFFEMVEEYQTKMEEAGRLTKLPERPDIKKINELKMYINEKAVKEQL